MDLVNISLIAWIVFIGGSTGKVLPSFLCFCNAARDHNIIFDMCTVYCIAPKIIVFPNSPSPTTRLRCHFIDKGTRGREPWSLPHNSKSGGLGYSAPPPFFSLLRHSQCQYICIHMYKVEEGKPSYLYCAWLLLQSGQI